jgi:hypothetical protein
MGILITINGANYAGNAVNIPTPPITFDVLSLGVSNVSHNNITHDLNVTTFNNGGYYEFAQTSEVVSAKITVPSLNSVPLHAICIGADADGSAIVVYFDNSGFVRKFDKSGNPLDILDLYTIPATRPNTPKGNEVTITHGDTFVTLAYFGYTYNLSYSDIPTLVTKSIGVLATGLGLSTYLFEKLS